MNGAITRNCGIEVFGLNLASPTEEKITYVKQALSNHGCVYFRDTVLTPEEHLSFAQNLAPININRYFPHLPRLPAIALVEKKKEQGSSIGERFHADHTYDMAPALGSMLVARELPEKGGDTVFVDMQKAYASLPDDIKQRLVGLRAVHSSRHIFGRKHKDSKTGKHMYNENTMHLATQDTVHPVVIKSPLSDQPSLFVNPGFTIRFEHLTQEESKPLLELLYHHAVQPQHMHRFRWAPNSVVLWDNRTVWHMAMNDYAGQYRMMHRVTIEGVPLEAADGGEGSAPYRGAPLQDPMQAIRWGESVLDKPFIQLMVSTFAKGCASVGCPELAVELNPTFLQTSALKALSWVGIRPKL